MIAWPEVFGIVAIVFLVLFRKPIAGFLDRTKHVSIGKVGVKASAPDPAQVEVPSAAQTLLQAPDSAVQAAQEQWVIGRLDELGNDPSEREKILVREVARAQLRDYHEKMYRDIWGSQLGTLEFLNTQPGGVGTGALHDAWYESALTEWLQDGGKHYAFDDWLAFMVNGLLITPPDDDNVVSIAETGRDFLKYLTEEGLSMHKDY